MQEYVNDSGAIEGVTLGEEAHIVAESDNGPRAIPNMPQTERDAYANRILLCEEHHKVIDSSNGRYFPVEVLMEMKREHEEHVAQSLGEKSGKREEATERAARFLGEWERRVELENWDDWTSSLLSPLPEIEKERFDRFASTALWLRSRGWPTSHFPRVRRGVSIFTKIWSDLIQVIDREFAYHRNLRERFCLREKHKEIDWDEKLYEKYGGEYDFNCDLIHELVFHLTAAANLMCDYIREELDAGYRFDEGNLMITRGPNEMLRYEHFSPTYDAEQRALEEPYPGLDSVKEGASRSSGHRPL
ncbi:hypothetical protein [Streptomyces sp. NPDC006691]|uniref:hypothetical protein n=1 Tax=Streptomyces sp. NPDC006691 TaxID=3364757 RepID=UPI0036794D4F